MEQTVTMTKEAPQRLRALSQANDIRLARAKLKRRIAMGEVSVAEVILASPKEAESWSVSELLMAQRRWGTERCRKFLKRNGIYELKEIGKLTDRQRLLLATQLETSPESDLRACRQFSSRPRRRPSWRSRSSSAEADPCGESRTGP